MLARTEPKRRGDKRERTRAALVAAACQEVAEKGFDLTSFEAVAARAGMTRGAVYNNFEGREDLLLAVVSASLSPVAPAFETGATFRRQMQLFGEAVAAEIRRRRPKAATMAAFHLYVATHPEMRARLARESAFAYRRFADWLAETMPKGALPMPAERLVKVLDALTTGLMLTAFQAPELISDEDVVAAFVALA